jgi:hypothetical protein
LCTHFVNLLTHSMNFRYILGVLTSSLNPQCTRSTTPSSALKPARRTFASTGVGAFLLIFVFHLCSRVSFSGRAGGGCLDCASTAPRSFYPTALRSFLQPRVLFSGAHARSCVNSRLASAWNADAGSVRAASRSPAKSWIRFVPGLGARSPDVRASDFYGCALSLGCSRTWSQCVCL